MIGSCIDSQCTLMLGVLDMYSLLHMLPPGVTVYDA